MPFLACVQSKLEPEAYRSCDAFEAWVLEQTQVALRNRDPSEAALVAFPELIGLPLAFFLNHSRTPGSSFEAALDLLRTHWLAALLTGVRSGRLVPANLLLPHALEIFEVFTQAFAKAALATRSFVVAGSSFLPEIEHEAARGQHLASARVQNVSYTFTPTGLMLGRQAKMELTKGLESQLGLVRAQPTELLVMQTPLGKLATLICFDAFFERHLERADALGTQILVQPSANAALWDGPWSADPSLTEGVEWWRRGPASRLAGRSNIAYNLNPMLVGKLFELVFEGRSSIQHNPELSLHPAGLLAVAPNAHDFAVVSAQVSALSKK